MNINIDSETTKVCIEKGDKKQWGQVFFSIYLCFYLLYLHLFVPVVTHSLPAHGGHCPRSQTGSGCPGSKEPHHGSTSFPLQNR